MTNNHKLDAKYVKRSLEFMKRGNAVEIRDCENNDIWQVPKQLAAILLLASFQDVYGQDHLINRPASEILKEGHRQRFTGYFPYDQIILQQHAIKYLIEADDTARHEVYLNGKVFYLCLVSENDYPIDYSKGLNSFTDGRFDNEYDEWLYEPESFAPSAMDFDDEDDTQTNRP